MSMSNVRDRPESRQQIEQFSEQAKSLRLKVNEAQTRVERARLSLADGNGNPRDLAEALNELDSAKGKLEDVDAGRKSLLGQLAPGGHASYGDDRPIMKALDVLSGHAHSSGAIGRLDLGELHSAEEIVEHMRTLREGVGSGFYAADSTGGVIAPDVGGGAARLGPWYGFLPQLKRRLPLLSIITQRLMYNSSFKYTMEMGSFDTAVETAELATRSPADVDYEDAEVTAVTIGHWFKTSRESIDDVPQLISSIDTRLMYGVYRRLHSQIIAGNGAGQNLRGVLNTTGIASVTYSANPLTELVLDGLTDVLDSDAVPDAVVMHPIDVATALKTKASTSGVRLDSDGAFSQDGAPTSMWGLPLVITPAMTQGKALVGDFDQGCTIWCRQGVLIRTSDSDQDDFLKSRLTFLAEGRWGFSVERPMCFAEVALA
jgi:HK97 family phage major capsid protein